MRKELKVKNIFVRRWWRELNVIELILSSIGVSLDIFAVTVCEGATYAHIGKKKIFNISFLFAMVQTSFFLIGIAIGAIPVLKNGTDEITWLNGITSIIIFILLGFHMISKAFSKKELKEKRNNNFSYLKIGILAIATSIDAIIMGIGIGLLDTKIFLTIGVMFVISLVCSVLGLQSGYYLGFEHRKGAYIIGGIILISMAIDIAIRH